MIACDDSEYPSLVQELGQCVPTCIARSPQAMGRMTVGETVPFGPNARTRVPWRFELLCEPRYLAYDPDVCSPWRPRRRRV
jgi:hypothetical protein